MGEAFIGVHRARAAVRLMGEVRELGLRSEPARRHLVEGLLGLLGCAVGGVVHDTRYGLGLKGGIAEATLAGFHGSLIDVFRAHHTEGSDVNPFHHAVMRRFAAGEREEIFTSTSGEIVPGPAWDGSMWINEYVRPARIDHFVGSVRKVGESTCMGVGLMRAAGDRPFSEEDREVLHLVHLGVGRFYDAPSPRDQLPPRARATMDELLLGLSDKEIAVRLGISPYTVRQYVKAILKAHGVPTRGQLIAREAARRTA